MAKFSGRGSRVSRDMTGLGAALPWGFPRPVLGNPSPRPAPASRLLRGAEGHPSDLPTSPKAGHGSEEPAWACGPCWGWEHTRRRYRPGSCRAGEMGRRA